MNLTIPLPPQLEPLAKRIDREERVLIVVGSGVSIAATSAPQASWLGLLKHGINHLVTNDVITPNHGKRLIKSLEHAFYPFDLQSALQHAEFIEQSLQTPEPSAYSLWLNKAFNDLKTLEHQRNVLEALSNLQKAGVMLLTTNYDSLLSDATGFPPITWEEHSDFLKVMSRQQQGILHIHGHWTRPTSVILGKNSYNRIIHDQDFQSAFKSLWLEWCWIYVGCGDGLDDPNLGRLLEWGKRWGDGALPHYFLSTSDKAESLANRADKPKNLISVGFSDHRDLPNLLQSLTPSARSWPFILVDSGFPLFRNPSSINSVPFPSMEEYLSGKVPSLEADTVVHNRLNQYNWAFIYDVASVGKTTLALRFAASLDQRNYPTYYLDLASVEIDGLSSRVSLALQRLSRPGTLFIIDRIHYQPELAWALWNQWQDRPQGSKLLLLGTRTQRPIITTPLQDLSFLKYNTNNPPIKLAPTADDLGMILSYIYDRFARGKREGRLVPPDDVLLKWHNNFGRALGAFCIAVISHLAHFQKGDWDIPLESASIWVRDEWLKKINRQNLENLLCLAVLGSQELELHVENTSLPFPDKTEQLLVSGLVARTEYGQFREAHRYRLLEPSWSQLILSAQENPVDSEKILFETAARHPNMAVSISKRLKQVGLLENRDRLWQYLAKTPGLFINSLGDISIKQTISLMKEVEGTRQIQLKALFWKIIESQTDKIIPRAMELEPRRIIGLLEFAKKQGYDIDKLINSVVNELSLVSEDAIKQPFSHLIAFLEIANEYGKKPTNLWDAIESQPDNLVKIVLESSPAQINRYLEIANRQKRNTALIWEAFERQSDILVKWFHISQLNDITCFLSLGNQQGRNTEQLWGSIESQLDRLVNLFLESPPEQFTAFMELAKKQGRNTSLYWNAIEDQCDKLVEWFYKSSLSSIVRFLKVAKHQGRKTAPLWDAIESQPDRLVTLFLESSPDHFISFIEQAQQQRRDTSQFWDSIESQFNRLLNCILRAQIGKIRDFFKAAKQHGRNVSPLWDAIESQPEKLAERAFESPLEHLGLFFDIAIRHGRNTTPLLNIIAGQPDRLAVLVKNASIGHLVSFCHLAPISLFNLTVDMIQSNLLKNLPNSVSLAGIPIIASQSRAVNRNDISVLIIKTLLKRANPLDFLPPSSSFLDLVSTIINAHYADISLLPNFIDSVCNDKVLSTSFKVSHNFQIASGLRLLVLYQPSKIYRRLKIPALTNRVENEIKKFHLVDAQQQSNILQLLGCAILFGCSIKPRLLINLPFYRISMLPVVTLPHRIEAIKVEVPQYQLWLGLHAITAITNKLLYVPREQIIQTLNLWKVNLSESLSNNESVEYQLNKEMVIWLEFCISRGRDILYPPERLLPVT